MDRDALEGVVDRIAQRRACIRDDSPDWLADVRAGSLPGRENVPEVTK